MTRILVTGATGFIGRHTVDLLKDNRFEVYEVDHKRTNLLDRNQMIQELERVRPTHLLHLAWDVSPGYLVSATNLPWYRASMGLLDEFIRNGGERAVFAGSSFDIYARSTLYGEYKEKLLRAATERCKEAGIGFAWGRVFQVYGAGEQPGRLVPYIVRSLLNNNPAYCTAGIQVRDFVYVSDVGEAFTGLCTQRVYGEFDIGTGTGTPVKQVVLEIARQLGKEPLLHFGEVTVGETDPMYVVANRQMSSAFDWEPVVSLPDGIARCIEYWRGK